MQAFVDERLLAFLPFYRRMWHKNNPGHDDIPEAVIRDALTAALEQSGQAKRVTQPDGSVHLVPTEAYLEVTRGTEH